MKSTPRYVLAPINFLPKILLNKVDGINDLIEFGIASFAKKCHYKLKDAARQALYHYYRTNEKTQLKNAITKLIKKGQLEEDVDFNGFYGDNFDPYELDRLIEIMSENLELSDLIIEYYQLHLAEQTLQVTFSFDRIIAQYKKLGNTVKSKSPMVSCNVPLMFSFREAEKTQFEIVQLVSFLAIKSILGEKKYVKTNFEMILSRMMGQSTPDAKEIEMLPIELYRIFTLYSNRYHREKLMEALQLNWNVVFYSNHMRGLYCSIDNRMKLDELAIIAESKKLAAKRAKLRFNKIEAKKKALLLVNDIQFIRKGSKTPSVCASGRHLRKVNE
jgi:hypothetical protein